MPATRALVPAAAVRAALPELGDLPAELLRDDDEPAPASSLPPALLPALAVLLDPRAVRVEVRAASTAVRRLTVLAALDGLAVALTREVAGPPGPRPVELALLPDVDVVEEVVRRLPPLPPADGDRPSLRAVDPALLHAATARGADDLLRRVGGWDTAGDAVVAALAEPWTGSLQLTVAGGPDASRLTWAHAAGAWWQLSPTTDADGAARLDVVPVRPQDLPAVVGALLGRALVGVGGVSGVTGGAGGVTARHDDLVLLARLHDEVGDDLRRASARLGAVLVGLAQERELVVAAALSPGTAARAAAEAADAVGALLPLAVGSELRAAFLQTAVTAYREADELLARAAQARRDVLGYAVGAALPPLAVGAGLAALGSEALEEAADAVGLDPLAAAVDLAQDRALAELQARVLEHPDLLEDLLGGTGGLALGLTSWLPPGARQLVRGAPGYPTSFDEAVRDLSGSFADGRPVLGAGGPVTPQDRVPPRGVADLLLGVDRRQSRPPQGTPAGQADRFARPGEIGVKRVLGADGVVRWVVELPGTEVWPLEAGERLRDTSTNVHTMAGHRTAYMAGVHEALTAAGVRSGQPVMLVGHSQGGMTAAALAADERFTAAFDVTHVVTAGSPIARTDVPRDVQVLALENGYDVVPRVDGLANPDLPGVTTVRQDVQAGSIGANHALTGYADRARELPDHPSVAAWQQGAQGFFAPGGVVEEQRNVTISREVAP